MVRHERWASLPVAAAIAAVLLGCAEAGGGNGEDGSKLLRREHRQQHMPPCGGKQKWSKNWAKMGMPCNYKEEVVYPGELPLPFPRNDVHAVLNKTKAMLKGNTYENELTTTDGPTTTGEARPQGAGIAQPLEALPTPPAEAPDGLKGAVAWREMTRSVPVSPLRPGQQTGARASNADDNRVPLPGGDVYRPHFEGARDQKPYFIDEDPKTQKRPHLDILKDSRDLHDSNVTDDHDLDESSSDTRSLKSTQLEDIEKNETKKAAMLRESTAMNQEVKGGISREADH